MRHPRALAAREGQSAARVRTAGCGEPLPEVPFGVFLLLSKIKAFEIHSIPHTIHKSLVLCSTPPLSQWALCMWPLYKTSGCCHVSSIFLLVLVWNARKREKIFLQPSLFRKVDSTTQGC